jgi:ribokinase
VLHAGANHADSGESTPNLKGFTHLLIQNEIPLDDTLAYLRAAGAAGVTSVYNPSPMPTVDVLRVFPWDCLSILIVNEGELAAIYSSFDSTPVDKSLSIADAATAQMHALHRAKGFNERTAIVTTIGPEGVIILDPKGGKPEISSFPAAKVRKVVDTTGAGDTFAGYFVAMLMEQGDDAAIKDLVPTCLQVSARLSCHAGY